MAIDNIPYPEARNLAQAEKAFYPLRIPVSHWQLRHYISNPEPDLLYYASGHDIYSLHTASKKRKHITSLPFEARCTASGYGWVCVGGEDEGHFAAIKLDGAGPRTLDVDSALPIEQQWRRGSESASGRGAASVRIERIGEEIVNSISIHRIQDEEAHLDDIVAVLTNNDKTVRVYSLPSNLETTVLTLPFAMNHATISPDGTTLLTVGDFNRAFFFQREIQETPPQIHKPHNRLTSASIEWSFLSSVNLHVSEPAITMGYFTTAWSPNGQLAAVGSEGGYITVFDIDILMNPDHDHDQAVVATVPSSRPDATNPHPGAVRSMIFSPEPWDLLIWAEDQGRVCIGDLRTGLKSRQVVHLDPKDEGLRQLDYEDVPGSGVLATSLPTPPRDIDELEADFIQRYRQAPDNATAVNFATEYIEARRRQRQQRQDTTSPRSQTTNRESALLEDDPRGLTAREQQILESLRTTRQREEARSSGGTPRTVNYTTPDLFRETSGIRSTSTTSGTGDATTRPFGDLVGSLSDTFPELSRTNALTPRPTSSHGPDWYASGAGIPQYTGLLDANGSVVPGAFRGGTWTSGQRSTTGVVRLSDGSRLPRRRASVLLTPPATDSPSADNGSSSTLTTQAQRIAAAADAEEENPWRTIEEHMTLARGPLFESGGIARANAAASPSTRPTELELQAELAAERARTRRLARQREQWRHLNPRGAANAGVDLDTASRLRAQALAETWSQSGEGLLRRMQARGGQSGREIGVRTAGLAMSDDGRRLWAACEEGIFEITIGVKGRMFWPAVDPR